MELTPEPVGFIDIKKMFELNKSLYSSTSLIFLSFGINFSIKKTKLENLVSNQNLKFYLGRNFIY